MLNRTGHSTVLTLAVLTRRLRQPTKPMEYDQNSYFGLCFSGYGCLEGAGCEMCAANPERRSFKPQSSNDEHEQRPLSGHADICATSGRLLPHKKGPSKSELDRTSLGMGPLTGPPHHSGCRAQPSKASGSIRMLAPPILQLSPCVEETPTSRSPFDRFWGQSESGSADGDGAQALAQSVFAA
jgi:hypothetical protein